MIWGLIGLILVAVLLALTVTQKNVGRALPLAAALVVGIIGFFAWYQDHGLKVSEQRIPADQVELVDIKLNSEARGVKVVTGRVRNHSGQYTLTQVQVQISMEDCLDGHCEVIDQTRVTLKPLVPPGQARDFRERVFFTSPATPRGEARLNYQVVSTRGE